MKDKMQSGSKGDSQVGKKKQAVASNAGSGQVRGGARVRGSTGAGGAKSQKSGCSGG